MGRWTNVQIEKKRVGIKDQWGHYSVISYTYGSSASSTFSATY